MLVVSNYHYIREDFTAKYPSIFGVTPKQFRGQLEKLATYGSFISEEELLGFRDKPFDKNYILISFDDGLKEQYELAKPILDEMGIPFLFFINTANFLDKSVSLVHKIHLLRSALSAEEILQELSGITPGKLSERERALAVSHYNYDEEQTAELKYLLNFKMGIPEQQAFIAPLFSQLYDEKEVASGLYFDDHMLQVLKEQGRLGSHSHRHLPLGVLSGEELRKELEETQEFFRSRFGEPATAISYPYGSAEASLGISREVKAAGFKLGFTMERAVNASLQKEPWLLSRFDCNDLPMGKNDLFTKKRLFDNPHLRKWYQHESSFIDQQ